MAKKNGAGIRYQGGSLTVRNRASVTALFANNRLVNVASAVVGLSSQRGNIADGFAAFPVQPIRPGAAVTMANGRFARPDIVQRTATGGVLSALAQLHGIEGNSDIVEIGGEFYVANDVHGIADLGVIGGNLLVGVFENDGIYEYTVAGAPLRPDKR